MLGADEGEKKGEEGEGGGEWWRNECERLPIPEATPLTLRWAMDSWDTAVSHPHARAILEIIREWLELHTTT